MDWKTNLEGSKWNWKVDHCGYGWKLSFFLFVA